MPLEDILLFFVSNIIDQFIENPTLVRFLSKNLSWGIFKQDLNNAAVTASAGTDFHQIYAEYLARSAVKYRDPEVMLFLVIELASSASYSAILFHEPLSMQELKPQLLEAVRGIIKAHEIQA